MKVYNNPRQSSLFSEAFFRHSKSPRDARPFIFDRMAYINLGLGGLVLVMVFGYVLQMNALTASNYSIRTLQESIASLNETHGTLSITQSAADDASLISRFAQQNNMIEANNVSYLFENGNVALIR